MMLCIDEQRKVFEMFCAEQYGENGCQTSKTIVYTISTGIFPSTSEWTKIVPLCAAFINPLTTNDDYGRHRNSAACYQLAQSVLKIGSVIAESVGQGEVGGCHLEGNSTCWLLQLVVEKPWPSTPFVLYIETPFLTF